MIFIFQPQTDLKYPVFGFNNLTSVNIVKNLKKWKNMNGL